MNDSANRKTLDDLLSGAADLRCRPDFDRWRRHHPEAVDALEALPADVREGFLAGLEAVDDWWYGGAVRYAHEQLINTFFTHGVTASTIPLEWREELRAGAFDYCWKPLLDNAGPEGWQVFDLMVKLIEAEGYDVPGYVPQS